MITVAAIAANAAIRLTESSRVYKPATITMYAVLLAITALLASLAVAAPNHVIRSSSDPLASDLSHYYASPKDMRTCRQPGRDQFWCQPRPPLRASTDRNSRVAGDLHWRWDIPVTVEEDLEHRKRGEIVMAMGGACAGVAEEMHAVTEDGHGHRRHRRASADRPHRTKSPPPHCILYIIVDVQTSPQRDTSRPRRKRRT